MKTSAEILIMGKKELRRLVASLQVKVAEADLRGEHAFVLLGTAGADTGEADKKLHEATKIKSQLWETFG